MHCGQKAPASWHKTSWRSLWLLIFHTNYQALLYLIGFIKGNLNKVLQFYQDVSKAQLYSILRDNDTKVSRCLIITFIDIHHGMINNNTAGNCHVVWRYHYVSQGTALNEHNFKWNGTKYELADTKTKPRTLAIFSSLWNL